MSRFYVTTPLYYVNAEPHIGHAYTTVAADALARFRRLMGDDVFFLTGTDEHGQKVARAASDAGLSPQQFVDKISATFRDLWKKLGVSYDQFIRTTDEKHKTAVRAVWLELQKRGEIYETDLKGWYCVPCERFLTDFEIANQSVPAGGVQNVICPDCKRPVEQQLSEKNYFFKMSKYQEWLTGHINAHAACVLPETRRNEVLGFLKTNKLEDLCISRPRARLGWGIACPLNEDYVTYVWFDALINYISACGYPRIDERWPADVHLVGKDILRHHAVYWPIILKALGLEPPRLVFAHGWWMQDKAKMSKSLGNVVDPVGLASEFGADAVRYFLLREVPFGADGTLSREAVTLRYNTDLANDFGNLAYRTFTMLEKYFNGAVPVGGAAAAQNPPREAARRLAERMERALEGLQFQEALAHVWALVGAANKFIEDAAPWKLAKAKDEKGLAAVMGTLAETLRIAAQAVWPFMPATAENLWGQLGLPADALVSDSFRSADWDYFERPVTIHKGAPLFPRRED